MTKEEKVQEVLDLFDIDTSDIPEVTDWSKAEIGKFYKHKNKAQKVQEVIDVLDNALTEEEWTMLVAHNCAGPCPCEQCVVLREKHARQV